MNNTNDKVGLYPGMSTLERARFGPGMLLRHDDLEKLNTYTRDLSRLMFQSFFGCGVVCGLVVSAEPDCGKLRVNVTSGLALACSGDPVYVPDEVSFLTDEKLDTAIDKLWVVLCGTKKCCAPRVATCSSDDDEATSDCTREKDTYEIRVLSTRPDCACGCDEPAGQPTIAPIPGNECRCVTKNQPNSACYEKHYKGECGCNCDKCSGCDCSCIVLARLLKPNELIKPWNTDHSVRRFIRPVLMRDYQVEDEAKKQAEQQQQPRPLPQQESQQARPLVQQFEELHKKVLEMQGEERRLKNEIKTAEAAQGLVAAKDGPEEAHAPDAQPTT